jgi:TCP-1/cpn60 chaperonin family
VWTGLREGGLWPGRRTLTKLRAKHAEQANSTYGINGNTGEIVDMKELGVWEPYMVKVQTLKTSIEAATLLLRIDDIVSGLHKKNKMGPGQKSGPVVEDDNVSVSACPPLATCSCMVLVASLESAVFM